MGIGRREFLRFVSTALGGLIVDPLRTVAVNGDYYVNTKLGLGFIKPGPWVLETFQDFATKLDGQIVQGLPLETDEEAFRRDQTSTMVATISKYGDATPRFSPSITVFKNQEERESLDPDGLDEMTFDAIDGWTELLKDYELVEAPRRTEISRCPSVRFKSRFVFEHRDIRPILINDETLSIAQGSTLYTIHLYDSPSTGDATPKEFERFLASLHIA